MKHKALQKLQMWLVAAVAIVVLWLAATWDQTVVVPGAAEPGEFAKNERNRRFLGPTLEELVVKTGGSLDDIDEVEGRERKFLSGDVSVAEVLHPREADRP